MNSRGADDQGHTTNFAWFRGLKEGETVENCFPARLGRHGLSELELRSVVETACQTRLFRERIPLSDELRVRLSDLRASCEIWWRYFRGTRNADHPNNHRILSSPDFVWKFI
jgi:hypothetical protein